LLCVFLHPNGHLSFILSNLSKSAASAKVIADLYRNRWKIENDFQELEAHFNSEINPLGYPPAEQLPDDNSLSFKAGAAVCTFIRRRHVRAEAGY
jgi:hypothetical protein